jgi:hypothetical protein
VSGGAALFLFGWILTAFVSLPLVAYGLLLFFGKVGKMKILGTLDKSVFEKTEVKYQGPRCVSCNEPIQPDVKICPECGWAQPRQNAA